MFLVVQSGKKWIYSESPKKGQNRNLKATKNRPKTLVAKTIFILASLSLPGTRYRPARRPWAVCW
jgi:hypothetical protein